MTFQGVDKKSKSTESLIKSELMEKNNKYLL